MGSSLDLIGAAVKKLKHSIYSNKGLLLHLHSKDTENHFFISMVNKYDKRNPQKSRHND